MKEFKWIISLVVATVASISFYVFFGQHQPYIAWSLIGATWLLAIGEGIRGLLARNLLSSDPQNVPFVLKFAAKSVLFLSLFLVTTVALAVMAKTQLAKDLFAKFSWSMQDVETGLWLIGLAFIITPFLMKRVLRHTCAGLCAAVAICVFIWPELPTQAKHLAEQTAQSVSSRVGKATEIAQKGLDAATTVADAEANSIAAAAKRKEQQLALTDGEANARQQVVNQGSLTRIQLLDALAHEPYEFAVTRDGLFEYEDVEERNAQPIVKGEVYVSIPSGQPTIRNGKTLQQYMRVIKRSKVDQPVCVRFDEVKPFLFKAVEEREAFLKQQEPKPPATVSSSPPVGFTTGIWADLPFEDKLMVHKVVTLKPGETSQEITVSVVGASSYYFWLPDPTTKATAWVNGNEVKLVTNTTDLIYPRVQGMMRIKVQLSDTEKANQNVILKVVRK